MTGFYGFCNEQKDPDKKRAGILKKDTGPFFIWA